jgi:nucleoside 2-deoxyribosyltransferase
MKGRIYVAGPYTRGDVAVNVRNAYEKANELADVGFAPFVPHATHFWHMLFPRPYEFWLKLDLEFIPCCDAVLRLPGSSSGADGEVAFANTKAIPVFYDIEALVKHFASLNKGPDRG